jgi:hypothetical protein
MIKDLENQFEGTGEVKGFKFRKLAFAQHSYLYEVTCDGKLYYEIFKRVKTPICIDFEKRLYSDTEFKEVYPKANAFGLTAWCKYDLEDATKLMYKINDEEIERLANGCTVKNK